MGIVYLWEPGCMEAFKVISFHATPTSVMLTFGENAGYAYPPHPPYVGDAHACAYCNPALCRGAWTPLSSSEFSRIARKKNTVRAPVPKSSTHIPDLLFVIASGEVWSRGQVSWPYLQKSSLLHHGYRFHVIIIEHVMALGHLYFLPKDKVYRYPSYVNCCDLL